MPCYPKVYTQRLEWAIAVKYFCVIIPSFFFIKNFVCLTEYDVVSPRNFILGRKFYVSACVGFLFWKRREVQWKKNTMIILLLLGTVWWFDRSNDLNLKKSILLKLFSCTAYKEKSLVRQSFVFRHVSAFCLKAPRSTVKKTMIILLLLGKVWWFDRSNDLHLKKSIFLNEVHFLRRLQKN